MSPSPQTAVHTEMVPIASLSLDPSNVNQHSERSIAAIKGSLARFGQVEPLVVHESVIIGGNGRLVAMQQLGWTHCSVHKFQGTRSEATALAIALNRSAQFSEFDDDLLLAQLNSLADEGFDLETELGFTDDELSAMASAETDTDDGEMVSVTPRPCDKVWVLIGCPTHEYGLIAPIFASLAEEHPHFFLEISVADNDLNKK